MTDKAVPEVFLNTELSNTLTKAVNYQMNRNLKDAVAAFTDGIKILMDAYQGETNKEYKMIIHDKIKYYMDNAEQLKQTIQEEQNMKPLSHKQIRIRDGEAGHSYNTIFQPVLGNNVVSVEIEDPYIRAYHQCQNFLKFCVLLLNCCKKLQRISLLTTEDADQNGVQKEAFREISKNFKSHHIKFEVNYSTVLHDRQIKFSNGWVVKIGRGLDYFKKPDSKFHFGFVDDNRRPCMETTVDIFHINTG